MASLTKTAIISRKIIRYTIYGIIFVLVARFVINLSISIYKKLVPPPPPKVTVSFGKLPTLPYPDQTVPTDLTYTLETPDGKLPKFAEQLPVFDMPKATSSLGTLDNGKKIAKSLGFNENGRPVVENVPNVYVFTKNNIPATLTINIITSVFSISYDLNADPTAIGTIPMVSDKAIEYVKGAVKGTGVPVQDLLEGTATTQYLKLEGGKFVNAISPSEADAVKVNLYRKDYSEKAPSVTPNYPEESNVWFIIGTGSHGTQLIAGEFHYYPVNAEKSATYPLKTSDAVWEELKQGKAYIANIGDNPTHSITIRKVYIGYYDAGQYAQYLQPVAVFEGDNGFAAFVSVIDPDYYGAPRQTE
jgi:hypothetical protein